MSVKLNELVALAQDYCAEDFVDTVEIAGCKDGGTH